MSDDRLSPVEMVHRAMQELGEADDASLAAFIHERFGTRIEPRFIPILKASVREREVIERARQAARALAERIRAEQEAKPGKKPRGKRAQQAHSEDAAPESDTKNSAEIRNCADGGAGSQSK